MTRTDLRRACAEASGLTIGVRLDFMHTSQRVYYDKSGETFCGIDDYWPDDQRAPRSQLAKLMELVSENCNCEVSMRVGNGLWDIHVDKETILFKSHADACLWMCVLCLRALGVKDVPDEKEIE